MPHLEITKVRLVHDSIVHNDYHYNPVVLQTFVITKSLGQFLDISPKNCIFLKTFNSEFSYIEVRFTDQVLNNQRQKIK